MTESWIIQAIENEAMARAIAEQNKYPMTFRFMGYNPEQMRVIMMFALRRAPINPNMSPAEIQDRLR